MIQVQRPWLTIPALSLKVFLYTWARFSIPNVSFLTDVAFTSHEWLPLLHSSISWKSKQSNEELQRWSWWPWWWWWLMVIIVMLNVAMKMITVMLWDNSVIEMISKKKMLSLRHIHVTNLQIIVTLRNIGTANFFTWVCLADLLPPM